MMRIRLFRAFASNNSGSYTIVGSFRDLETAKDVAKILREVSAEHDVWYRDATGQAPAEGEPPSPLERFAKEHGLAEEWPGRDDDWPEFGQPPAIIASGCRVIVYVDYTVTMPRAYGEYFYRRGGRVSLEMEHAHRPIAVEFVFNPKATKSGQSLKEVAREVAAFRLRLDPLLIEHSKRPDYDERPPIEPAWCLHDVPKVNALLLDLPKAVEEVQQLARAAGLDTYVRLFETDDRIDPFAALRSARDNWGQARVILWTVPEDRIKALQVVRSVAGSTLQETKNFVDDLPVELLVDVDNATATDACERLKAAGCDAEAVTPREQEAL